MKTIGTNLGTLLMLFALFICQGQTPQQQKQIAEAEKMAAEAQRISDSVLNSSEYKRKMAETEKIMDSLNNSPQMRAFFEQMEEKDDQNDSWKEAKEDDSEKASPQPEKYTGHLDRFIITKGSAKKFPDWSFGQADIVLKVNAYRGGVLEEKKIGRINPDGSFSIDGFPESMQVEADKSPVADYFATFSEDLSSNRTQYTGGETGIKQAYMLIVKNGEDLGSLSLATSRQQAYNDSPVGQRSGDLGYRVSLWYADGAATVEANTTKTVKASDGGETVKNIPMTEVYDLSFKPGLNYMKEEVVGSQNVGVKSFYKTMKYTTIDQLPNGVKWVISSSNLLKR